MYLVNIYVLDVEVLQNNGLKWFLMMWKLLLNINILNMTWFFKNSIIFIYF